MSGEATLEHLVRPAAGQADGALVLFHGRGASEDDLYPLLDMLDPERRLVGVTPRGPLQVGDRHLPERSARGSGSGVSTSSSRSRRCS